MEIFFDEQIFLSQNAGGISRYFCELATALKETGLGSPLIFGGVSRNQHLKELRDLGSVDVVMVERRDMLRLRSFFKRLSKIWRRIAFMEYRWKVGEVLYHPTLYDVDPFISGRCVGTVVTFHDMIPEWLGATAISDRAGKQEVFLRQRKDAFERANAVVSVSHATAVDICKYYGSGQESKIKVAHHGTSKMTHASSGIPLSGRPYFLFVGNRSGYKNGLMAIKALGAISATGVALVFFGGPPFSPVEVEFITENKFGECVFHCSGSDAVLADLYTHAVALVYPSLYEGFGLPILEALSYECEVIAHNGSCIPEVGGNAIHYANCEVDFELAAKMAFLLTKGVDRSEFLIRAAEQVSLFSWARSAEVHYNVYQEVVLCSKAAR